MTINRDRIIGNLSNYDIDFDEDDINGSEGEDDYEDDEPDYEELAQRKKENEEWEAENYWGSKNYPDNRGW